MGKLICKTRSNEVDEQGIVTIAVSSFNNVDSQDDIIEKGAFKKTVNENFARVKHLLNHDTTKLIGCPIEGNETDKFLLMKSALNLDTEIGRDVFSFYKQYAKYNRTLEHSIMAEVIKRDNVDNRRIKEVRLWEYSTLFSWGANENTPLIEFKNRDFSDSPQTAIKFLRDSISVDTFSDAQKEEFGKHLSALENMVKGKEMTTCRGCGFVFDASTTEKYNIEDGIANAYNRMVSDVAYNIVWEEVRRLEPQIRTDVLNIVNSIGKNDSLLDYSYVICPRCGEKIYMKNNVSKHKVFVEPSRDTPAGSRSCTISEEDMKAFVEHCRSKK